jgi:hypothetical protein
LTRALDLVLVALTTMGCQSVLGIDGQFDTVPQAFCTTAGNTCPNLPGFDEAKCERGIANSLATGDQFKTCEEADAGCQAFVQCMDKAAGGCVTSGQSTLGFPCTTDDPTACCAPQQCSVTDGGVGVCQ